MSQLDTPFKVSQFHEDYIAGIVAVEDCNGFHALDCHKTEAGEIVKRINGYEQLEASNRELLEALKNTDAMLRVGIFRCTSEELRDEESLRQQAITNAKQGEK